MDSRVEWIYHTLEDEAHFLDSNNVLDGCRNALWDLLRRKCGCMGNALGADCCGSICVLYFRGDKVHPFFLCITFIIYGKKQTCGQKSRSHCVLRSAWLHQHTVSPSPYAPRRVIKAMKIMFSGILDSLNKWFKHSNLAS